MCDSRLDLFQIDVIGKPCPMPLLMLKRTLKAISSTQNILLKASDPHSEIDILRYCQLNHLTCKVQQISHQEFHFLIARTL